MSSMGILIGHISSMKYVYGEGIAEREGMRYQVIGLNSPLLYTIHTTDSNYIH